MGRQTTDFSFDLKFKLLMMHLHKKMDLYSPHFSVYAYMLCLYVFMTLWWLWYLDWGEVLMYFLVVAICVDCYIKLEKGDAFVRISLHCYME